MAGGTTIANVAMGDLKDILVPLLPMKTQQRVLEKYVESQELRGSIDELTERMKSIEAQIFHFMLDEH